MKTLTYIALGSITVAMLTAQTGNRKVTQNAKSPSADTSITLGSNKITIEYNAPSLRGRKPGDSVDPYNGKVWRLGADSATTLTNDADIMIGDLTVPKGAHTLYIFATDGGWKLVVNKQTGQWGTVYKEDQDLGRVDMKASMVSSPAETLKINLKKSGASAGTLEIEWGNTKATVAIKNA